MDRAVLSDYVQGQFAPLISAAGITIAGGDTITDYGPALDSVMRQLGLASQSTDPNPTIPPTQEGDALLLTRYYVLDWLLLSFASQVDRKIEDLSESASQRYKLVVALLQRAQEQLPSQYSVTPGDFAVGRLQLDIFEPITMTGSGLYPWY